MPTGVYDHSCRLGLKHSEATKRKLSLASKGRKLSAVTRQRMSDAHKGITKSESDRKAISERQKGNQVWLGRKHTAESRQKMSECARKGADSNFWKGGVTPVIRSLRSFKEYRVWRTAVFERDNYTCQACGIRGGKLEADHIKRFSEHPELRFDIRNGRTLCVPCHKTTDNYGRRGMASRQAA